MRDFNYLTSTINKLQEALEIHRSKELSTVLDELKSKDVILAKSEEECNVTVRWTDDAGDARSFVLKGYGRQLQGSLKACDVYMDKDVSPEVKRCCAVLEKDRKHIADITAFMECTDMVEVKKRLPELKPFMTLVENDRKREKERENAEWRKTYEICIELFGDEARG